MLKLANLKIEVGTAEEYQGREVDAMIARVHYQHFGQYTLIYKYTNTKP